MSALVCLPNSADGLVSAAFFQMARPTDSINLEICSVSSLASKIRGGCTGGVESVHILGVGTYEYLLEDVLQALQGTGLERGKIFWYCGRGYLDQYQKEIAYFATTHFIKAASNAEGIYLHFGLKTNAHTSFLLALALEYKKLYEKNYTSSSVSNEWQSLIEALCETQFLLSRQIDFSRTVKNLSVTTEWKEMYDEIISFYKNKIKDNLLTKGKSAQSKAIRKKIDLFARSDEHVLIIGPSGTGKDLAARDIHLLSKRSTKPYIAINCSDFQGNPDLARSRLFGHAKGAFTGASTDHQGVFEVCNEGTIFLDELGELPLAAQSMLLRVLESGEFEPQGGKAKRSQAKVIAATNQNLRQMVLKGLFRHDLFYRLNVLTLQLPSLIDRMEDVLLIARAIIKSDDKSYVITQEDEKAIKSYHWPGNFRELRNIIKRAVHTKDSIASCIYDEIKEEEKNNIKFKLDKIRHGTIKLPLTEEEVLPIKEIATIYAKHVYKITNQNCKVTADHLGVAINTARKYLGL